MKRLNEILPETAQPGPNSSAATETSEDAELDTATEENEEACTLCGGAGFLRQDLPLDDPQFGKVVACECTASESEDDRRSRLQRYSSLGPLTRLTFENLIANGRSSNPRDRQLFGGLVADARTFAEAPQGWLLIHGPSGAGKTHVAAAVANHCLAHGIPALFVVVPDLLDHLRAAYSPNAEVSYDSLLEQVRNAPLLVLDDLGTQHATAWAQEKLFQVLNHRYSSRLPTIVTTNLAIDRLDERLRMRLTDPEISRVYYVEAAAKAIDVNLPDALDLERIREMTFENFDVSSPHLRQEDRWSLENAYRCSLDFAEGPQNWLLLVGANGCGKSHLAAAIANRARSRGERPVFFMVADLLDYLRHLMDREAGTSFLEGFNQLRNAPLLILDDLDPQSDVGWVKDRLFQVINHRFTARLPTVITATPNSVQRLEERIAARLNDPAVCTEAPITAPAYRVDMGAQPGAFGRRTPQATVPSRGRPRRSR